MSELHGGLHASVGGLAALCEEVEESVDTTAAVFTGANVWPLVRLFMRRTAAYAHAQEKRAKRSVQNADVDRSARKIRRAIADYWTAIVQDRGAQQLVKRSRNLFATHSTCRVPLGRSWYDMFFDPLVDDIESFSDYLALEMVVSGAVRQPRYRPSRYILPYAPSSLLDATSGISEALCSTWVGELRRVLQERRLLVGPSGMFPLAELLLRFAMSRRFWRSMLSRVQPRRVMIATWYSPEMMALSVEAKRSGAETIDIQHGVQGSHHWMYSGWSQSRFGPEVDLMPKKFWVWRETERRALEKWSRGGRHSIEVVGNRWLEKSEEFLREHGASELIEAVDRQRDFVLFTQQTMEAEFLNERILGVLRKASRQSRILVRMHPAMSHRMHECEVRLQTAGVRNVVTGIGDTAPLSVLLRRARMHVTHNSSVIIEAGLLGTHTIASDPDCREKYRDEYERGLLSVA